MMISDPSGNYRENDFILERDRQDLLRKLVSGFYQPQNPDTHTTIFYVFVGRNGKKYYQCLGQEESHELDVLSLSSLRNCFQPMDVGKLTEILTRNLRWVKDRSSKLKKVKSP